MKLIVAIAFLFAVTASAQTAQVIQLNPEDAARAKALYAEKAKVDAEIEALKDSVKKKYVWTAIIGNGYCTHAEQTEDGYCIPYDWANGFEFSTDFRFIVPAQPKPQPQCPTWENLQLTGHQP